MVSKAVLSRLVSYFLNRGASFTATALVVGLLAAPIVWWMGQGELDSVGDWTKIVVFAFPGIGFLLTGIVSALRKAAQVLSNRNLELAADEEIYQRALSLASVVVAGSLGAVWLYLIASTYGPILVQG